MDRNAAREQKKHDLYLHSLRVTYHTGPSRQRRQNFLQGGANCLYVKWPYFYDQCFTRE
jgi:hypothetical protein